MSNIPSLSDCAPGLRPTGFNVLVAVADEYQRVGNGRLTEGGIWLTESTAEKNDIGQVRGRIVAVSPAAFDFAEWPNDSKPRVGDAIVFAKFAGILTDGMDKRQYRLIDDKSVAAIIEEDAA